MCYKSTYLQEGRYSDTSFTLGTTENTNLTIGGFLARLHRSPLTFLFAFSGFTDNPLIDNARDFQPTDKRSIISWCHLWGFRISGISFFLSSAIPFTDKGLKWFGQDQGLLVQAFKRVGTLLVIPTATVNRCLPCNHLLSNMCSPWLPLWRS